MNIKILLSNFNDKRRRFLEVMKKRLLSVIIGTLLILSFLIVRISLAENLLYISDDIYILGCEMVTESGPGPKLKETTQRHKETLKELKTHIKQRTSKNIPQSIVASASRYPGISWFFREWDQYTAEKAIDKALDILSRVDGETDPQKIIEAIWQAGEQLLDYREKMISFRRVGRIRIGFYKKESMPVSLQNAITRAIAESESKMKDFVEGEKSWEKAWALCEANRKSVLLLFLARSINVRKDLEYLKEIIEKSHAAKKAYSETFPKDNKKGKLVTLFAESDERRLGIIESIQTRKIDKAIYLMWQAKEDAKRNKSAVLDIALNEEY